MNSMRREVRPAPATSLAAFGLLVVVTTIGACSLDSVHEGFVTTKDGVRLYYRSIGRGEQTVIAPLASFHSDRLDPLARSRRLVLYDPRGRGRSEAVDPSKVSLDYQVSDLEAVRDAVGADKIALIGWSGLGMEIFVYALRHPDRVTRVVQLAPVPPRRKPYEDQMMKSREDRTDAAAVAALEERRKAGEFKDSPSEFCRALNRLTNPATFADPARAAATPDVCEHRNEWPENLWPYFDALLGSFGDYDWRPDLPRIEVPRLVIHGAQDNIPLEGTREWVAGQRNARLLIIENAGHWPHYEQQETVLQAIDSFLSGEWPRQSEVIL